MKIELITSANPIDFIKTVEVFLSKGYIINYEKQTTVVSLHNNAIYSYFARYTEK